MPWDYIGSSDFYKGVLVEFTGVLIELLLLAILIPLAIWIYRRYRIFPYRFLTRHFFLQILHRSVDIFISLLSVDVDDEIRQEWSSGEGDRAIFNHFIYGNLEYKLYVVNKRVRDGTLKARLASLSDQAIQLHLEACCACLAEIDSLATAAAPLALMTERFLILRFHLYALRDALRTMQQKCAEVGDLHPVVLDHVESAAWTVQVQLSELFEQEKKPFDRWAAIQRALKNGATIVVALVRMPFDLVSGRLHRRNQYQRDLQSRMFSGQPISMEELLGQVADQSSADAVRRALQHGAADTSQNGVPAEDQIRELAFIKWEQAGSPAGRDEEFWRAAKDELEQHG